MSVKRKKKLLGGTGTGTPPLPPVNGKQSKPVVLPSSLPPEYRPLLVSEDEVKLLRELVELHHPAHRILVDLKQLHDRFRDTAIHLTEMVKVARANAFWEDDKSANAVFERVGRGAKERRDEAEQQLAEQLLLSPEEVRQLIIEEKNRQRRGTKATAGGE